MTGSLKSSYCRLRRNSKGVWSQKEENPGWRASLKMTCIYPRGGPRTRRPKPRNDFVSNAQVALDEGPTVIFSPPKPSSRLRVQTIYYPQECKQIVGQPFYERGKRLNGAQTVCTFHWDCPSETQFITKSTKAMTAIAILWSLKMLVPSRFCPLAFACS